MVSTGISFPEWVLNKAEEPLGYDDSRSERIVDLTRVGLAAEDVARSRDVWPSEVEDQETFVRRAVEQYVEPEPEDEITA